MKWRLIPTDIQQTLDLVDFSREDIITLIISVRYITKLTIDQFRAIHNKFSFEDLSIRLQGDELPDDYLDLLIESIREKPEFAAEEDLLCGEDRQPGPNINGSKYAPPVILAYEMPDKHRNALKRACNRL